MIGLTLKFSTLAGEESGTPDTGLLESYGGPDAALEALREQGIGSIEISSLSTRTSVPVALDMIRRIYDAGLKVTLHGRLENIPGEEYLRYFAPVFELIFAHQDSLSVTVHGLTDRPLTERLVADWAGKALPVWPGLIFAEENQRVKNEAFPGEKAHYRIDAIPALLPDSPNVGICWDMGHYAYNVLMAGKPLGTLPGPEALSLVRQTHIHSLKDLDTHHPLERHPIEEYVRGLKSAGYRGIYNLEVKPPKYYSYRDVREGMEDSIRILRDILGE